MAQRMMASVQHQVAQALIQMNPANFKTKEKSVRQAQTSASLIPRPPQDPPSGRVTRKMRSPVEKHADGGYGEAPVILLNGVQLQIPSEDSEEDRRSRVRSRFHGPALEWSREHLRMN
ncbi:unnamed protein product [Symbiodinium sp. CCMP2592]|nr:unnamed protein product [Symbiodinium sp. CCMP2592]